MSRVWKPWVPLSSTPIGDHSESDSGLRDSLKPTFFFLVELNTCQMLWKILQKWRYGLGKAFACFKSLYFQKNLKNLVPVPAGFSLVPGPAGPKSPRLRRDRDPGQSLNSCVYAGEFTWLLFNYWALYLSIHLSTCFAGRIWMKDYNDIWYIYMLRHVLCIMIFWQSCWNDNSFIKLEFVLYSMWK